MMEEHYKALEHLVTIEHTDVTLSYNTNLSNLRYKRYNIVDLWNQFEKVDVWASLDGMDGVGDYQRKGQDWTTIESNIRYLQAHASTVLFGIDITVSVLNIFHIPTFYQYLVENKLVAPDRVNLYFLRGPEYFSVTNLTPTLKEKAAVLYKTFTDEYLQQTSATQKMKAHATALITFMLSEQLNKQAEFKLRISETDQLRNENFNSIFPELAEMFANN
jgi:MoaA/NifB/PqqE/SkfB family radical SAM enzyme